MVLSEVRWRCAWLLPGLLAVTSVPAVASWGSKHEPVPDWATAAAKTPTPAFAQDAAAVVLHDEYLETVDPQGRATELHRKVMRILKPQGRDNACTVFYDVDDKIKSFRAWTIAADEKVYQAQATDFTDFGAEQSYRLLYTAKVRVATPPAIDVGAVLVCESEELRAPYDREEDWNFQMGLPVVSAALEVDLPAGMKYADSWHRHDFVKPSELVPGHLRWELKNVPALRLRDIPSTPDWEALAARMTVLWGDEAVEGTANQWRAIGKWVSNLEAGRSDPSPEITAAVQQLMVGAPDFYTKLSRITELIQKDVRYFIVERGIGGMQANYASEIFRNRYGDCKDKTTLLISMLQVAGIKAHYLLVDDRRGVVDPDVPSVFGNHMVTAIELPSDVYDPYLQAVVTAKDGKRYLIFDPTNERTPVGNLPSYEQGSYGLMAAGEASQVLSLPILPPDDNGTVRNGIFTLAADGTLTGTLDARHMGPEGADWRMLLKYSDATEQQHWMEKIVAEDLPGVTLNKFKFIQQQSFAKPLELHYEVTVPAYAHTAGNLLLVRPRVLGSDVHAFDDNARTLPIDLDATGHWHDSYDITLPPGYVVDDTPDPVDMTTDFATYKSSITAKGNVLHFERDFVLKKVEIPASDAGEYRKLESRILSDEKGTAVLKKE